MANKSDGDDAMASEASKQEYKVLVEFAFQHLDFQLAELESVLDMHGIKLLKDGVASTTAASAHTCRMVALAKRVYPANSPPSITSNPPSSRRPFVLLSLPFDSPFVPPSAISNPQLAAGSNGAESDDKQQEQQDIATILLSRCTLVRSVLELWGMATSLDDCATVTQKWMKTNSVGQTVYKNNSLASQSWKLTIHTLGSKYTREEQDEMRLLFSGLELQGPVQMKDPCNEFVLIREIELDAAGGALYPRHAEGRVIIQENDARSPLACYFGRALGGCRSVRRMGGKMKDYSLKRRQYLGPTSMDAELSFIMTNLGQVRKGRVAFDPFVGTGSILLSCALRGAYTVGTDIDIRILRGRSANENILTNFTQFGLPRPELVRSDNGIYHRHFRTNTANPMYDAILCDPPYGIRAGARKTGSKRAMIADVKPENRHDHIAQTQPYAVSDVMADLMDVAARTLVFGGRLVYIIPSFANDFDADNDLPQHPCLELVHACYQPLSTELGRRMVTMKKIADYDPDRRSEYLSKIWKNGPESAEKCANLRDKIMEAAKSKPRYEERAAIRKEKRRQHKQEKKVAKKRAKVEDNEEEK